MNDKIRLHVEPNKYTLNPDSVYNDYFRTSTEMDRKTGEIKTSVSLTPTKLFSKTDSEHQITTFALNNYGLSVVFNPNKVMKKPAGQDVLNYSELQQAIEVINETYFDAGFNFNIKDASVTRYDASFDLLTDEEYNVYSPIITKICPISTIRRSRQQLIEDTAYIGNDSQKVVIYSKTKEDHLKENVIRFEHRLLKLKKENKLHLKSITESKYKALRTKSKNIIHSNCFTRNPVVMESEILTQLVGLLNTDRTGQTIRNEIAYSIIQSECLRLGIDASTLLREDYKNRRKYDRNMLMQKGLANYFLVSNSSIKDLFEELKTKFKKAQ